MLRDCFLGNGLQLCPEGWLFYFFKSIFGCIGSWLLCKASSSCGKWGLVFLTVPGLSGFSCCRAQAPGTQASVVVAHSLRSCGPWAQLLFGMWDLPGPGMEPVSPALAGRVPSLCHQGNPERWCLTSLFHFPFCLSKYYHLSWVCWWERDCESWAEPYYFRTPHRLVIPWTINFISEDYEENKRRKDIIWDTRKPGEREDPTAHCFRQGMLSPGVESLFPLFLPPRGSSSHCPVFFKHLIGCVTWLSRKIVPTHQVYSSQAHLGRIQRDLVPCSEIREQHHFHESTSAELVFGETKVRQPSSAHQSLCSGCSRLSGSLSLTCPFSWLVSATGFGATVAKSTCCSESPSYICSCWRRLKGWGGVVCASNLRWPYWQFS